MFHKAKNGTIDVLISSWSLPEVHKKKGDGRPRLDQEQDEKIIAFFEHEWIKLVEVDRDIGVRANQFCRTYGLAPGDAVHLACALRAKCDVLLTWDGPLARVSHPGIRIEAPRAIAAENPDADGQGRIHFEQASEAGQTNHAGQEEPGPNEKPVSLHPLSFEEALKALLQSKKPEEDTPEPGAELTKKKTTKRQPKEG